MEGIFKAGGRAHGGSAQRHRRAASARVPPYGAPSTKGHLVRPWQPRALPLVACVLRMYVR
eukprot:3351271-Prymnesium_polylepis.1